MEIQIDEGTIAIITTLTTVVLGIISRKFQKQSDSFKSSLDIVTKKAELGAQLIKKIRDANEDNQITTEEFNGIVETIDELVNKKD